MLKPIEPQNMKYNKLYTEMAEIAANQSVAARRKVGAVIVLPTGILSIGFNGTPPGFDNACEWSCDDGKGYETGTTKPEVIHAERNAIDKLTRQGISTEGAILFVTTAPCIECAKSIAVIGIKEVHYKDIQSTTAGLDFLTKAGIPTFKYTLQRSS
jgi:dCMP deaminase